MCEARAAFLGVLDSRTGDCVATTALGMVAALTASAWAQTVEARRTPPG